MAHMEEMRNAHTVFVKNPEGKSLLRRCKCKLEDNLKINIGEIWWESVDWIHAAETGASVWLLWTQWWTSGSIKCRQYCYQLRTYYLLKDCAVWSELIFKTMCKWCKWMSCLLTGHVGATWVCWLCQLLFWGPELLTRLQLGVQLPCHRVAGARCVQANS